MKAITLWQPWASLIVMGLKTIETRTHPRLASLKGQRFAIHAGLHFDWDAANAIRAVCPDRIICYLGMMSAWPRGVVLGTAFCVDHRLLGAADSSAAMIDCEGVYLSRWGLILPAEKIEAFKPPIPAKGHQGIWNWEKP
jgi:hypothetical protein